MSRAATIRLKVNPPCGELPVLQYCGPDQLNIDPAYQRAIDEPASQALIRRIAVHWDWGLCQPLFVARRPDGALYVVDGQHRLAAAKMRNDIWQLPCVVRNFQDAADEAASFVALNQERRPLNKLQVFKAALASGDEESLAIAEALDAAGLRIASTTNLQIIPSGAVSNVGGLLNCYRAHGPAVLSGALAVMADSWPGEVMRYAGTLFPGIAAIVADEMKLDRQFDLEGVMVDMIGAATQIQWARDITQALADGAASSRRTGAEHVFRLAWSDCRSALTEDDA